jgi:hypothetical protein
VPRSPHLSGLRPYMAFERTDAGKPASLGFFFGFGLFVEFVLVLVV